MKHCAILAALFLGVSAMAEDIDNRDYNTKLNDSRGADIRANAEESILAISSALGHTNRPIAWTALYASLDAYATTHPNEALLTGQRLQTLLLFWTLNGGDPWKVGTPQ